MDLTSFFIDIDLPMRRVGLIENNFLGFMSLGLKAQLPKWDKLIYFETVSMETYMGKVSNRIGRVVY
ncbi:hypothetical protein GCM10025777_16350 [Membranihabitans marinus]